MAQDDRKAKAVFVSAVSSLLITVLVADFFYELLETPKPLALAIGVGTFFLFFRLAANDPAWRSPDDKFTA